MTVDFCQLFPRTHSQKSKLTCFYFRWARIACTPETCLNFITDFCNSNVGTGRCNKFISCGQNILEIIFIFASTEFPSMVRISKYIMRIALLLMLFQFFAPAFFPLVVQAASNNKTTTIHVRHSSVVAPLLLKEKDEKERDDFATVSNLAPLLDLTAHSINLSASHKGGPNYIHQDLRYDLTPALFTRFCTFLIWEIIPLHVYATRGRNHRDQWFLQGFTGHDQPYKNF